MRLKRTVKKGLALLGVYFLAMICVFMMAERIERLEVKEKAQIECNMAVKINK